MLQTAYQRGDALTAAGMATMVTNAVPIVASFVLFGERLPSGIFAALQILAFGCLVVSAVALGHQQVPPQTTDQPAAAESAPAGQLPADQASAGQAGPEQASAERESS